MKESCYANSYPYQKLYNNMRVNAPSFYVNDELYYVFNQ